MPQIGIAPLRTAAFTSSLKARRVRPIRHIYRLRKVNYFDIPRLRVSLIILVIHTLNENMLRVYLSMVDP